jgi:hypothetical protein
MTYTNTDTLTDAEIVTLLGGITATARIAGVKPPSVHAWTVKGIPEGQLVVLAARVEKLAPERFSRKARWPDTWAQIWPELAQPEPEPEAAGGCALPEQQPAQEAAPGQAV